MPIDLTRSRSAAAIGIASGEAQSMGLSNARFEVRDAASLSGPATFDFITTFDAVHDQAHPDRVLRAIYDLLRPGEAQPGSTDAINDIAGSVEPLEDVRDVLWWDADSLVAHGDDGPGAALILLAVHEHRHLAAGWAVLSRASSVRQATTERGLDADVAA